MTVMQRVLFTTSWDDGHMLDARIGEMLARHDVKGTFYVLPPEKRDDALSLDGIRLLAQHHEIGAHTLSHSNLHVLHPDRVREEVHGSKKWVEDVTGKPCRMFCYPRGYVSDTAVTAVRDAGFTGARTVEALQFTATDPFRMPTTLQMYPFPWRPRWSRWWHPFDALGPLRAKLRRIGEIRMPLSALRDWQSFARGLLHHAMNTQQPFFHVWGHAKEIDRYNQWEDLEKFLRYAVTQGVKPVTNYELLEELDML
jgi:peptidoglycan/xylan/chitin deacetylase (PgdA/CDA1 family)